MGVLGWVIRYYRGERVLLEAQIDILQAQLDSLDATYQNYRSAHSYTDFEYDALNVAYQNYKTTHSYTNTEYEDLKSKYDNLTESINKGQIVAGSATWLSEDKRLNVTSELIPKFLWETLWSYTVRVTITNVGTEPLDKVWIFLFPYVDGKLYEYWNTFSYSHSVESLYMGETYSYNFTSVPKEMTTYKVFAIAG